MTPDQQLWLGRAKELAAQVQSRIDALDHDPDLAAALVQHIQHLLDKPEWHDAETLDAFLKDMLPLAGTCASLEGRLPDDDSETNAELAWDRLQLAAEVSVISRHLLAALSERFPLGTTTAPLELIQRLTLSASVAVRWWPKALQAMAERELGQALQPAEAAASQAAPPSGPELLLQAAEAAAALMAVTTFVTHRKSVFAGALHAKFCAPATMASALGNLAAVYAHFVRFPATFNDQADQWAALTQLAADVLYLQGDAAVAAVEENEDVRQQLAAALLPYASHLLEVADLSSASWFRAWEQLVRPLAAEAVWPDPEAALDSGAAQPGTVLAEGLLRLLRALPPPAKPPQPYCNAFEWLPIPLYTAKAALVAASKAFNIADRLPPVQVQRVAALRSVQQQGFRMLLALLPLAVDVLAAAAEQLAARAAPTGGRATPGGWSWLIYGGFLMDLCVLLKSAATKLKEEAQGQGEQVLRAQPRALAAAAEAALRLAAQADALVQPYSNGLGIPVAAMHTAAVSMAIGLAQRLLRAAKQEVSAAPEAGGVRPSLQAQLRLVHTICKFARAALVPGTAASGGAGMSEGLMHTLVLNLLDMSSGLLVSHMLSVDIPHGRAPLTPAEKRSLIGAALALVATSSSVVDLLPEGPASEAQRVSYALQLCRLLKAPELADALLAQRAERAEQVVAGMAAVVKEATGSQATEVEEAVEKVNICFQAFCLAVHANRRLGPIMLAGAAGQALEAALRQNVQGVPQGVLLGRDLWFGIVMMLTEAAEALSCFHDSGCEAATQLQGILPSLGEVAELPQEVWEALREVRAAAEEWLAQEEQQQWRQEQLLLCAEAAATRACANLACTKLAGASEVGLKGRLCSGCRCVRYCSTACQRADWAAGHKAVCKQLQARQAASG